MAVYKRGNVWWYKFRWNGKRIQETTRQTNKRVAQQLEAAHRTRLLKGGAGIPERKSPTLARFMREAFIPFLEATKSEEPNTVAFYKACTNNVLAWPQLAESKLSEITSEKITAYIEQRQRAEMSVATINRELATLRRALRLASEWGKLAAVPKIELLDGETCRERVLNPLEESAYLKAAEPQLRTFATIMLDCGLRPDEVYRLQWDVNYRDGQIVIHKGKTRAARRAIPVPSHLAAILRAWHRKTGANGNGWIFPAPTKTGHINHSSLKKAHRRAMKASSVEPFEPYDLRHTCLTRWARYMDPFTLKKLAGHESLETTMKYIHLNETESARRLRDVREKLAVDAHEEVEAILNRLANEREDLDELIAEELTGYNLGYSDSGEKRKPE